MTSQHTVGIAGTGALGSALAQAALAHGLDTSVWNRTAARTTPLAGLGAVALPTAAALFASAPVIVVVLSTYDDVRAVLDDAGPLQGRVVVNLSSGTPAESAAMARDVHARGANYIDGAAMGGTRRVGDPAATFFYSGDADAFTRAHAVLESFGTPVFLGADPAMASAYDTATLGMILGFLTAGYQALALLDRQHIDSAPFVDVIRQYWPFVVNLLQQHANELRDGAITSHDGTVDVYLAALRLLIDTAAANGVDTAFSDTIATLLQRASREGHGGGGLPYLAQQFATEEFQR